MTLLVIIAVIAGGYLYYQNELKKEIYRIKVIDLLNGKENYITDVDGIQEKYSYSPNPGVANLYHSFDSAKRITTLFGGEELSSMIIEKRVFSFLGNKWLKVRSGD